VTPKPTDALRRGERVALEIERLDDDGAGIGVHSGLAVHVARALPGERVLARVDHLSPHRPQAWAALVTVERESPARVAPACAGFGLCGGCVWQHLAYPSQLAAKRADIERALGAELAAAGVALPEVAASPAVLGYRNKAKYVVGPDRAGRLVLGSYLPRSHDIVDMAGCRVIEPALERVAGALAERMRGRGAGSLRHVVMRANHAGRVLVVLVAARARDPEVAALGAALGEHAEVAGVVLHVHDAPGDAIFGRGPFVALVGAAELEDRIGEVRLHLSAGAFFQVNRTQAAALYAAARDAAELRAGDGVLELYAGAAGITLTLAPRVARAVAVEEHAGAAADARASVGLNGAGNVEVVCAEAGAYLARGDARPDVVVVDPPRKGMGGAVIQGLGRLGARTLMYVSCSPASLARDVRLLGQEGYRVTSAAAFDLFPHTPHVETMLRLDR